MGTPLTEDLELSVSKGIVSGLRTIDGLRLVQTDAAISPGYSGGPLVAENGRMVGVISFKAVGGGAEGLAFAIPSTAAAERLGLWFGEASDELPEADLASFGPAVAPAVEDVIEPLRTGKLPPALASELRSRQGARLAGGLSLVAVGIGTSLAASAVWSSDDAKTPAAFGLLHTADVAGWAVALTGAWLTIDTGRRLVELKSR